MRGRLKGKGEKANVGLETGQPKHFHRSRDADTPQAKVRQRFLTNSPQL
jgi:hypothetical protein